MTLQEYKREILEILKKGYNDNKMAEERMELYKEEIEEEFNLKILTAKEVAQGILMNLL